MNIIRNIILDKINKRAKKLGVISAPKPLNEKKRIFEIKRLNLIKKRLDNDYRFSSLPKLASYLTKCPQAAINIIDDNSQYCKVSHGRISALSYLAKEIPRGLTTCQHVLNNNLEPLIIEDCSIDMRMKDIYKAYGGAMPKFYAGSPIVTKGGFILGSFCVFDEKPKSISNNQLDGLRLLADQFIQLLELVNDQEHGVFDDIHSPEEIKGEYYSSSSILFADFVGFTKQTELLQPGELIELLSAYFNGFDKIMNKFGLRKVKTIGDSYMAVGGIPEKNTNHAYLACQAGLSIIKFVKGMAMQLEAIGKQPWEIRVGINTGAVIAGYNGTDFDIWGDSVNVASRMESSGISGKVHISESTKKFIPTSIKLVKREKVDLKNKGKFDTYIIEH